MKARNRIAKRVTEKCLVDVLVAHLHEEHTTGREIEHYNKRIDVAMVHSGTKEVWAIEVKVANWRRAIMQAILNLTVAERSYIAMYSPHAGNVSFGLLDEHGIGLIAVGTKAGEVTILKKAIRSPYINRLGIERIRNRLMGEKQRKVEP